MQPQLLDRHKDLNVEASRFGLALTWNHSETDRIVDLDLQAVAFNDKGRPLDAVFYSNKKALGGSIIHSGDDGSFDEVVWVELKDLQEHVHLVIFVVACFRGGRISDAPNGRIQILEDSLDQVVSFSPLIETASQVAVLGLLRRDPVKWVFRITDNQYSPGQHFMDILDSLLEISGCTAPKEASFLLDKGSVVDLPKRLGAKVTAVLSWDLLSEEADLDVSAVMLDSTAREVDCVFFGNEEAKGIRHSSGDDSADEQHIILELDSIPEQVEQVILVINIYTLGRSFAHISNPRCRLINDLGHEILCFHIKEPGKDQALIVCRIFREPGERWGFHGLGQPCPGRTYKDSLPSILHQAEWILFMKAKERQNKPGVSRKEDVSRSLPAISTRSSNIQEGAPGEKEILCHAVFSDPSQLPTVCDSNPGCILS